MTAAARTCCCHAPQVPLNYYYRAMGMKVSSNACLQTLDFNAYDVLTIEGDASLEQFSVVEGITYTAYQQGDKFPLGTMHIKVITRPSTAQH
jgi:hypothetical protein